MPKTPEDRGGERTEARGEGGKTGIGPAPRRRLRTSGGILARGTGGAQAGIHPLAASRIFTDSRRKMANKRGKPKAIRRHHVLAADADLQKRLGGVIRACRHQLGITQEELAWRADIHRTYIADIERGARNVTLRSVANVAKALEITIGHLFATVTAPAATARRVGAEPAPNAVRDILLVEHNAAAAAATARAFERAKLANPLRIVCDGEAALDYLFGTGRYARRRPVRPQLILLVHDLPRMSGAEFLRRVKGDERTRDIPVVLLTVSQRSARG